MSTQQYQIQYQVDVTQALAGINQLIARLTTADQIAQRLQASLGHLSGAATQAGSALQITGNTVNTVSNKFQSCTTNVSKTNSSLGGLIGVAGGLGVVRQAVSAIDQGFLQAAEFAKKTTDEAAKMLGTLRELASLQGKAAPDRTVVSGTVRRALSSGMSLDQAREFETMWEGAIPAARDKGTWKLNDQQTEYVKSELAAMATRMNISPKTMGEFAPLVGTSETVTDPQQFLGKMAMMSQMAAEGVGEMTPIFKVAERLRGDMVQPQGGGAARSAEELMAIISTGTIDAGNPAATTRMISQVWRELSSRPEVARRLGIKAGTDFVGRIEAVDAYLAKTRAKGIDDQVALRKVGLRNGDANRKILEYVNELPVLQKRTGRMGRGAPLGANVLMAAGQDVVSRNEEWRQSEAGQAALAEGGATAARIGRGMETLSAETYLKNTETTLQAQHQIDTSETNTWDAVYGATHFGLMGGQAGARERRIIRKAAADLMAQAKRLGVDTSAEEGRWGVGSSNRWDVPDAHGRFLDFYNQLAPKIRAASQKGDTTGAAGAQRALQGLIPVPRPGGAAPATPQAGGKAPGVADVNLDASQFHQAVGQFASAIDRITGSGGSAGPIKPANHPPLVAWNNSVVPGRP